MPPSIRIFKMLDKRFLRREQFSPLVTYIMWLVAEVGAMATDLAEFTGAARIYVR